MKVGFFAIGIGPAAEPELIALTAKLPSSADFTHCGLQNMWC